MMTHRVGFLAALITITSVSGTEAASFRTRNFVVTAPTAQLAQEFGQLAEHFRKEKALEWLGYEMPAWPQPCPLRVTVTQSGAGGATQFNFTGNQVYQTMHIEGGLDRLRDSVLPHEVTHTVFAHHFRQPVPRWADEGGSVLSEDDLERRRHDKMCRSLLNSGRGFQLQVLFTLRDYPDDVMVLYAEGYSITRYLVDRGGRQQFLNFLASGMQHGWDHAVKKHYGFQSVKHLERAWIDYLRAPESLLVHQPEGREGAQQEERVVVHDFAPPAQPQLGPPVVRGASPDLEEADAGWNAEPVRLSQPRAEEPVPEPEPISEPAQPRRVPTVILLPPEPIQFR